MSPNSSNTPNNKNPITPVAVYLDAAASKSQILKDNKGKSGVYRWTNKENGKTYIGSSVDIGRRFSEYFIDSQLEKKNMAIHKAILKYGHSNFSFEIKLFKKIKINKFIFF
jgi:hypothetical protein